MRWLLLDEIVCIKKGQAAYTVSRVPDSPVSSELLMIEMMAQTGALLLGAESNFEKDVVFTKIEKAIFPEDLKSGDPIEIQASSEDLSAEGAWLDGKIHGDGKLLAESRFLLMNVGHLVPGRTKPITFHDQFMNYFQVRSKLD